MPVDLRSDTFTRPTPAMRRAMAEAEVGDDVWAEDPTVRRLEETVAGMFGHEAALYVPSGTMGNQIAVRLVVPYADELLCEAEAHVVTYEGGGLAQLAGVQTRTLLGDRGILDPAQVAAQVRPEGWGTVPTRAVAVEQTHNRGGGSVWPLESLHALRAVADDAGVALHCDGARIWNAAVASGVSYAEYGAVFDTLSVCFSKGLGAPVGSAVVASAERIAEARALRRRLGGGMRQAGMIAAGALYALEHHVDRLAEDHARARRLAEAVAEVAPHVVDVAGVETNIVRFDLTKTPLSAKELAARAAEDGVLVGVVGERSVRALTHLDVDDAGVDAAADVLRALLG